MTFEPPGLERKPEEAKLVGFVSLMPVQEKQPSLLGRIVRLPLQILALPFRLLGAIVRFPLRLFGIGRGRDNGSST